MERSKPNRSETAVNEDHFSSNRLLRRLKGAWRYCRYHYLLGARQQQVINRLKERELAEAQARKLERNLPKRAPEGQSTIMKSLLQICAACAIIGILIVGGKLLDLGGLPKLPISHSFRVSMLDSSGLVLQVHNTSNAKFFYVMTARNKRLNQVNHKSFTLGADEWQELGLLEAGWSFKTGEQVWIESEGYLPAYFTVP